MHIGEVLRAFRLAKGLSETDLYRLSAIPQGTISRIETGKQQPRIATTVALAQSLGVSVEELLRVAGLPALPTIEELRAVANHSQFNAELWRLEAILSPEQQAIVVRVARALALETRAGRGAGRQASRLPQVVPETDV